MFCARGVALTELYLRHLGLFAKTGKKRSIHHLRKAKGRKSAAYLVVVMMVVGDSKTGWWKVGHNVDSVNNSKHLSDL
jgi:hypothetical protein